MKKRLFKGLGIALGALVCTTLGIFASDSVRGIDTGISNLASVSDNGVCQSGSVPLRVNGNTLCVDMYEASPSSKCPHQTLTNIVQTEDNAKTSGCYAASVPGAQPWTFVSLPQAQRLCAGAGKRLPTSEEWYQSALGTEIDSCAISTNSAQKTGERSCVSSAGSYDVVGNVWEWVNETITGKDYGGRSLPDEGYVTSVDENGIAISSAQAPDELYGRDYFWSGGDGVFGMIRGGFYGSNQDAGLYTTNASVLTSFASQGVGFRCVKDVL